MVKVCRIGMKGMKLQAAEMRKKVYIQGKKL